MSFPSAGPRALSCHALPRRADPVERLPGIDLHLCTALRLARYNVQASGGQKRTHFTGLPCPAPAGFLAALVLVSYEYNFLLVTPINTVVKIGIHILLVSLAGMMVSTITFPDFSSIHVEKKNVYQYNVIIVLILCVAVLRFKEVFTILVGTYIMAGPIITLREHSRQRAEHPAGMELPKSADLPKVPKPPGESCPAQEFSRETTGPRLVNRLRACGEMAGQRHAPASIYPR